MSAAKVAKAVGQFPVFGTSGESTMARGTWLAMRLWEENPGDFREADPLDYSTVGFVIEGSAEIESAGERIVLNAGDSWVVPRGVQHKYRILRRFRAVEAAQADGSGYCLLRPPVRPRPVDEPVAPNVVHHWRRF